MQATEGFLVRTALCVLISLNRNSNLLILFLLISFNTPKVFATFLISLNTSFSVLGLRDIIFVFRLRCSLTKSSTSEKLTAHTSH